MSIPAAEKPRGKRRLVFEREFKSKATAETVKKASLDALFLDTGSVTSRTNRQNARKDFEFIVKTSEDDEDLTQHQIWNKETIIDRTNLFLFGTIARAESRVFDKVKTSVLYAAKRAIYWWAIRFIDDFASMYAKWHTHTMSYIRYLAFKNKLHTGSLEKNNLTDAELALFYRKLHEFPASQNIENWKQHYATWLLVWTCAIRPGSFTVGKGYAKGDLTSQGPFTSTKRDEDETLRWSDVRFIRFEEGIGVRITFQYLKNHRNPYGNAKNIDMQRTFTFPPARSNRYELDVSAIFFSLAFNRGLFVNKNLNKLLSGTERTLLKDSVVNKQAVFVAATTAGVIDLDKPMNIRALGPKLNEMCETVGLYARNTLYSFRRTAIVETRRRAGTEMAGELAVHKQGSSHGLAPYDDKSLADVDMTNFRLNVPGMSRDQIREMFSQAKQMMFDAVSLKQDLPAYLHSEIEERLEHDKEFIEMEKKLRDVVTEACALVQVPDLGYTKSVPEMLRLALSAPPESGTVDPRRAEVLAKLDDIVRERKALRKRLRLKLRKSIKDELLKENTEHVKQSTAAGVGGNSTQKLRELESDGRGEMAQLAQADRTLLEGIVVDDDEEDDVLEEEDDQDINRDLLEGALDEGRQEPEQWAPFGDQAEVTIETDHGDEPASPESRTHFIREFVALESLKTSGLKCIICLQDPSASKADREKKYTLFSLDAHVKTAFHTRRSQLRRAFEKDFKNFGEFHCSRCSSRCTIPNAKQYMVHMEKWHPEQFRDMREDRVSSQVTDFEGFDD